MELEMLWILSSCDTNLTLDAGWFLFTREPCVGDYGGLENHGRRPQKGAENRWQLHYWTRKIYMQHVAVSLCRDSPDAQKQVVGRGHSSRVTPLLLSWSSCSTPLPHPPPRFPTAEGELLICVSRIERMSNLAKGKFGCTGWAVYTEKAAFFGFFVFCFFFPLRSAHHFEINRPGAPVVRFFKMKHENRMAECCARSAETITACSCFGRRRKSPPFQSRRKVRKAAPPELKCTSCISLFVE